MTDKDGNELQDPTTKQRAFIEHYLTCWNATEAARRAGYSVKTANEQGARLLSRPHIKANILSRTRELQDRTQLGQEKFILRSKPKIGYVYLIREKYGLVKIGKAIDADRRIASIRAFLPYAIETLFVFETDNADKIEKHLHNRFRSSRKNGEWFALSATDIESVRQEYVSHE